MATNKAVGRMTRLLGIVEYLETHGPTEFAELGAHFGVDAAQVRDDVNVLWVSGRPGYMPNDLVDFDYSAFEEGIASLTEGQGLRQVMYSAREAAALTGALSALVATGTAPDAAATALEKLTTALGGTSVQVVDSTKVDPAIRAAVDTSLDQRQALRLTYIDAQERKTQRNVEPHRLVVIDGAGYLECYCLRADDYRLLRVDRIADVEPIDVMVTHPPVDRLGFSIEQGSTATVRLARAGRWALEDLPHAQVAVEGDDVIVTFAIADPDWIAGRLLAVGAHLKSVEPAPLAEAVRKKAQAVVQAHSV
ncbi:helix-turn-helix transcriptional regulator [Demequina sediminicola]|uniref:helix-turn-helix transcriptional regulator n=1 Tax=Demequina sediminicola TaxID=1095026 RepID=UPI000782D4C1|nr:WYL domain-containing protein [Demequina sediminicola]